MKKFLSLTLAAVMAFGLAACGSSSSSSASGSTSAAAEGTTFKIGGIGPVTGGAAIYGTAVKNAAQLAVDEINRLNLISRTTKMTQKRA